MNSETVGNEIIEDKMPENSAPEGKMAEGSAPEGKKKLNKSTIIAICALAWVVVALIVAVVLVILQPWKSGDNCSGMNCEDTSTSETESADWSELSGDIQEIVDTVTAQGNTELSSGTYTATIGGKQVTYNAAYLVDGIEATISSGTYESSNDDEVVFLVVNGGSLTVVGDVVINKTGSADFQGRGDDYSFYGKNSAVVVVGENSSASIIGGVQINTSVSGANAVVATAGGMVGIGHASITTAKDNSRGLHATYEGSIGADTVVISTQGESCAALATDRGEGYVTASNMTLSTAGAGSPLIYSTGEISVSNSTGTATGAQIAVVEGKNSLTIADSDFSANGVGNRNGVDNAGIMIYQSMSGDAGVGVGSFMASNSTFTILPTSSAYEQTPMFFVTNTTAEIELMNVTANFYPDGYFVLAAGTSEWGKSGSNGGIVTVTSGNLTASNTNIGVDEISSVTGL